MLEITVAAGDSGPVVKLSGECDLTVAGQLRDALEAQLSGGMRCLTVDLSGLRFADSVSIRVLLDAYQVLTGRGGILELAFPQPAVATVLSLLGVNQMLTVRTRADAAGGAGDDASLLCTHCQSRPVVGASIWGSAWTGDIWRWRRANGVGPGVRRGDVAGTAQRGAGGSDRGGHAR